MTLNGVMAITLRYFNEYGEPVFEHITALICVSSPGEFLVDK